MAAHGHLHGSTANTAPSQPRETPRLFASDFDFDLPEELIAQHPATPRDSSRLMIVDRRLGTWQHRTFADLPELLDPHDILIRNNTRVIPARLVGHRVRTGGKWEGLFLREHTPGRWEILAKTRGRPMIGETVIVGQNLCLVLEARGDSGSWIVRPELSATSAVPDNEVATPDHHHIDTHALLFDHGQIPLPPYIRRGRAGPEDRHTYQTVYAQKAGSVAAPTAGLHFTDNIFHRLAARGITWVDITLHVGLGTFRPIETEQIDDHVMHAEWAELSPESVANLQARRRQGGRIVAVGTTSARTLEAASASGSLQPFTGNTSIFIRPGHNFHAVDALLTNFHLPRSSLIVLIAALAGTDLIKAAYADAIQNRYRFFSYGDAMLII
jgi:S-adenosylmethionine:tRNA ribosyltransferase-isomerase